MIDKSIGSRKPSMFCFFFRANQSIIDASFCTYLDGSLVGTCLADIEAWYCTLFGRHVFEAESAVLKNYLPHFFGYYLIQLGGACDMSWLASSPIAKHCRYSDFVSPDPDAANCNGAFDALPFANESVDVLFLPHVAELFADPQRLIEEAQRVLVPQGVIIFLLFNPYRINYWQSSFKQSLPHLHWHTFSQMRKRLTAQNFGIESYKTFSYRPYTQSQSVLQKTRFMETLGQTFCPKLGNNYLLIARKKQYSITPIPLTQKKRPILFGNSVTPTTRNF